MRQGTPSLAEVPQRLRAMAEAFEQGLSLTEVALRFRVPIRELQRVVAAKRCLSRESKVVSRAVISKAAEMIRERHTYKYAAHTLGVNISSLIATMHKQGLTADNLRAPDLSRKQSLERAVALYRERMPVKEISMQTGISQRALYEHFQRQGVVLRQPRRPTNRAKPADATG